MGIRAAIELSGLVASAAEEHAPMLRLVHQAIKSGVLARTFSGRISGHSHSQAMRQRA
jgi:hypothetical protein